MRLQNKTLILLVGNIGSGKSTFCNKLAQQGYIVCSRDSMRYMIGGGDYVFDLNIEPILKDLEVDTVDAFMFYNYGIIIDETNINKANRKKYINLAKEYGYKVIAYVFPELSMEESINRRLENPHGEFSREVWEKVWMMFYTLYEDPTYEEGIDTIICLE